MPRALFSSFLVACILFTMSAVSDSKAADVGVYVLNTSTNEPYTTPDQQGFQDLVVAEVFRRIGLKGRVSRYDASARALINANNDVDQGVAMRIKGLEKRYPNLVRVDEVLIENDFVAYSLDQSINVDTWESLRPYSVVYINGWVIFENNLDPKQDRNAVKEPRQMFEMLEKGRTDLVLYERWQGLYWAAQSGLKVKVQSPPLASVNMYMYVHKNHADLAPKMAEALRAMKADGTYQNIFDKVFTPLAPTD